ncbi:tRNA uridine(34) 5-carboxymethylaminomethyl modification radical SAM/GNAT enzyme Elp3 [Candidatus Woesearchaeota archaeon]|nr:tRNA uridine(34) 5-carboxymethylaminomethyl modification radical SAM/GNAT enzyme Elp3 [Candidatus Woesearchaeota archaeon]
MSKESFMKEILEILKEKQLSKEDIARLKIRLCKEHKVKNIPTDIEILLHAKQEDLPRLKHLQTKPTRSISGVTPIAVMSKPQRCPHGACIMCPSMTKKGVPQSYTGKEPATMRGARNKFDPYLQIFNRLEQYMVTSHVPEKVELIIMGGTFPAFPIRYQDNFVMYCFKAMNDFSRLFFRKNKFNLKKFKQFFELPGEVGDPKRTKNIQNKLRKLKTKNKTSLKKEQRKNETSKIRCIGMTIETRPDYAKLEHCDQMLKLGCTRVELGVQSVYDSVLTASNRGHDVHDTIAAFKTLKDLCFKINAHYMLGLPGSTPRMDLEGFKKLFKNPAFRPDMLKLYPCMVVRDSKLYKIWKKGKFKPLNTQKAASLIAKMKKHVPEYARIMRVQRDIPTYATEAGVDRTNLRQYVEQEAKKINIKCRCIRCREAGHVYKKTKKLPKNIRIKVKEYNASAGKEFFISAEDTKQDILLGFCRLRFPSESLREEITKDSALIRELHVYGTATAIGKKGSVQHKGYGKKLMAKAEQIAKRYKKKKMLVISGIGVREYYIKLGYHHDGPYVSKAL